MKSLGLQAPNQKRAPRLQRPCVTTLCKRYKVGKTVQPLWENLSKVPRKVSDCNNWLIRANQEHPKRGSSELYMSYYFLNFLKLSYLCVSYTSGESCTLEVCRYSCQTWERMCLTQIPCLSLLNIFYNSRRTQLLPGNKQ